MKIFALFLLFIIIQPALAAVSVQLDFFDTNLKQGQLEAAKVTMAADAAQNINLQKLRGASVADTLYFYELGPLIKKDGGDYFIADAQVIFLKIPESPKLIHKLGNEEIIVAWPQIEILPTEGAKELIFGQFEIPSRKKILLWVLISLGLLTGLYAVIKYRKQLALKKAAREKKIKLKEKLFNAADYFQIVEIWQKRDEFLQTFPEIRDHFKKFEIILFKHQFKPHQTETEKSEVMTAYREFLNNIQGGLSGI
ncbi:MAG: hypothetical protein NDI69_06170 [Bacteriovoracaceae bacterium]|nr:hypothetical protein [Bacteriovoracaceae bacterium]